MIDLLQSFPALIQYMFHSSSNKDGGHGWGKFSRYVCAKCTKQSADSVVYRNVFALFMQITPRPILVVMSSIDKIHVNVQVKASQDHRKCLKTSTFLRLISRIHLKSCLARQKAFDALHGKSRCNTFLMSQNDTGRSYIDVAREWIPEPLSPPWSQNSIGRSYSRCSSLVDSGTNQSTLVA